MHKQLALTPLAILAVLICFMVGAGPSHATFLSATDWLAAGDGLLTYDSNSNLEWLELTETQGLSYSQVNAQLGSGGSFEGFSIASVGDVTGLLSAGAMIPDLEDLEDENRAPVGDMISLMGDLGLATEGFYALTSEGPNLTNLWYSAVRWIGDEAMADPDYGLIIRHTGWPTMGTWLYRERAEPIPEPSTIALLGLGIVCLALVRNRKKQAS